MCAHTISPPYEIGRDKRRFPPPHCTAGNLVIQHILQKLSAANAENCENEKSSTRREWKKSAEWWQNSEYRQSSDKQLQRKHTTHEMHEILRFSFSLRVCACLFVFFFFCLLQNYICFTHFCLLTTFLEKSNFFPVLCAKKTNHKALQY